MFEITLDFARLFKYLLEGLAVAVAAFFIPRKNVNAQEILLIGLTAAATFAVLDYFSPFVGSSARQGAGFGIGYNMVTGGAAAPEVEADEKSIISEHSVPLGMDSAEDLAAF